MRKLIMALFALMCCASSAVAQEVEMVIHLTDGSSMRINVDSVVKMTGTEVEYPWNRVVNYYNYEWPDWNASESFANGRIEFGRQSGSVTINGPGKSATIAGKPIPIGNVVNSISFGLYALDPELIQLPSADVEATYINTAWHDSLIYTGSGPIIAHTLDSNLHSERLDTVFPGRSGINVEVNLTGTRMMFTQPRRGEFGMLVELDLAAGILDTLVSDSPVSSARYVAGSDDVIYYSVGSYRQGANEAPKDAGFFRYDRQTESSKLLVRHLYSAQRQEIQSGFDVTSDGKTLITPVISIPDLRHLLAEYNISTGVWTLLDVEMPNGAMVWLQYDPTDSRILYSAGWLTKGYDFIGEPSIMGVIDRATLENETLIFAPRNDRPYCAPYPRWSPDGKFICYGAVKIQPYVHGTMGKFGVYIKRL